MVKRFNLAVGAEQIGESIKANIAQDCCSSDGVAFKTGGRRSGCQIVPCQIVLKVF